MVVWIFGYSLAVWHTENTGTTVFSLFHELYDYRLPGFNGLNMKRHNFLLCIEDKEMKTKKITVSLSIFLSYQMQVQTPVNPFFSD